MSYSDKMELQVYHTKSLFENKIKINNVVTTFLFF
jgi:hypothetical protein